MNSRYAFIFTFGNRGWNIICFNENGSYKKYFTSDEDYFDDALDYVDLFLENGGNRYEYKIPSYEKFTSVVTDDLLFKLKDAHIKEFEKYRK